MDAIETKEYKGFDIKIYNDDPVESPREWDNLGKMVCFHSRYNLGDEHEYKDAKEWLYDLLLDLTGAKESYAKQEKLDAGYELSGADFMAKFLPVLDKYAFTLPLYLLDHSGITMNTTGFGYCDPGLWDSGQVGIIYVLKSDIRKEWKVKRIGKKLKETVLKNLRSEVKTYDQYLTGDIYGYQVKDKAGEDVDSCWGYYGHEWKENDLLDSAQGAIDYHIKEVEHDNLCLVLASG